jgi:N-acetylmuramoyl-L-alanine amidase CwlA
VKDEDIAWHCGAKSYKHKECRNSNSIGVELCVKKDKNGKWYYTDATKQAAVRLFAYLMDKYDIPLDHVLRHYDVTGKTCGEPDVRFGNKVWSTFKKELAAELGTDVSKKTDTAAQEDVAPSVPYRVQTTCDALNIRSGAGAGYPVVGSIQETVGRKKAYTIVEEKNGWGKLKSGAGWISLAYTKKAG